jgi:hypothetical protein
LERLFVPLGTLSLFLRRGRVAARSSNPGPQVQVSLTGKLLELPRREAPSEALSLSEQELRERVLSP